MAGRGKSLFSTTRVNPCYPFNPGTTYFFTAGVQKIRMPENPEQPQKRPSRRKRSSKLPADAPDVVSPCISICEIDQASGVCKGCYRTLEEIATWSRMENQQRWDIVQSLRDRRRSFDQKLD